MLKKTMNVEKELKSGRGEIKKLICNNIHIYIMLIPVVIYYFIFTYVPMYGLTLAFKSFKPGGMMEFLFGGKWQGLKYFRQILTDPLFLRAFKNTVIIGAMKIGIHFPLVIIFALFLNELRSNKLKNSVQTLTYLPHFFSWVVFGGIMIQLLSVEGGALSHFLSLMCGGKEVSPLTSPSAFRWVLLASTVFKETGWDAVIFLAAIAGVDQSLYEAASVDGAGRFRKMFYVTIPSILPTICTVLLIKISYIASGDFDQVFMIYNTSVYETGDIIETYLYRIGIANGKFSMATAMGIIKAVISGTLLISCNKITKKLTQTGIY
ncbi:ABC transporter permease [Ructibacterium gallinarum]|uniref:Sugar ABC transporter permease n=1 Tax=Ructibacterium gallinarum TaxID=2779355 RepID=A0A9D5M1E8_9FIRM|nr:ABC transporter permease subunit [Ructibacterium gallinarum]MBE5040515.1 sugar ABC transporter permease [Ructibacterium gallinarum]